MEIRRLRQGDEDVLKAVRLRGLAEDPSAFAATLEQERRFTPDVWTSRVTNESSATFLAEDGGPVGTATVIPDDRPATAQLVGMWVAPEARGKGIGRLLVDTVAAWARDRGVRRVTLWVTEGNDPARALYERAGFADTGERQPLPSDPALMEARLEREL
jgi:GNAT superfamily N-acetyltransferase